MAVRETAGNASTAAALVALALLTAAESAAALQHPLSRVWDTGDVITRGTLVCLLVMGLASWWLLLMRLRDQSLVLRDARAATDGFWGSPNLYEAVQRLRRSSPFRMVVERGLGAAESRGGGLVEQIDVADRISAGMQRSVDTVAKRLQSGLDLVASIGAAAPWVGLFGTLWGTYRALTSVQFMERQTFHVLAGPVGEALLLTGLGLAVAVPVLLAHRLIVRRNLAALASLREFSMDVQAILVRSAGGKRAAGEGRMEGSMLSPVR